MARDPTPAAYGRALQCACKARRKLGGGRIPPLRWPRTFTNLRGCPRLRQRRVPVVKSATSRSPRGCGRLAQSASGASMIIAMYPRDLHRPRQTLPRWPRTRAPPCGRRLRRRTGIAGGPQARMCNVCCIANRVVAGIGECATAGFLRKNRSGPSPKNPADKARRSCLYRSRKVAGNVPLTADENPEKPPSAVKLRKFMIISCLVGIWPMREAFLERWIRPEKSPAVKTRILSLDHQRLLK